MKIYLVGGAVRDKLLGRVHTEKDWVVVGATPEEMLKQGYRQVGKDFPVFLHPKTHEEYALARTERKVGRGYKGFVFDTSPGVTLEEDLIRRDLTINAMAETMEGKLIDPYHGKADLDKKILRHVSNAFAEDPVRILRTARFAARFAELGFTVADETMGLMKKIVQAGEVNALVPERVWKELERALSENHPEIFFIVLMACDALPILFKELVNNTQGNEALVRASQLTPDLSIRFAAMLSVLSVEDVKALCARYRVPSEYSEMAVLAALHVLRAAEAETFTAEELADLFQVLDAYRRPARFQKFLTVCKAATPHAPLAILQKCFTEAKEVDTKMLAANLKGKEIADFLYQERIKKIKKVLKDK
ncbi:MAG: hypothetical protein ACD_60C00160G0039 [uncultured bacterium]|nr:MAG: hypothetical protein ACD_60C00160G0039 [uncultured bacterium]